MRIDILTLFPEMFDGPFGHSIIRRALDKGIAEIRLHQLRDWATDRHRTVDDYPFGGGAGMVMMAGPVVAAIEQLQQEGVCDEVIFLTPDGEKLTQQLVNQLSTRNRLLLVCGHYKGLDERVREGWITREISVGDYVLSGGEIAAMALCDSMIRVIPGAISDETSALSDSFQNQLLSPPVYTRPAVFRGIPVPEVLLSGNDKLIRQWKDETALKRTRERRPDLLDPLEQ